MKTCRHCGEQKDRSEFPVHREKRDGLSSWCRACHAEACARWRAKHPEAIVAYNRRRRAEYADERDKAASAAAADMNRRLREQTRRNRERDERRRALHKRSAA
jgi:hypothetical protein